ncbi:MAG: outer membrane protein assembly factor BamA [Alphaproteobacteria bacterium]|nr:outer membrane protein assembly factor BamA [Alphaproteobacteria bacterium]
MGSSAEEAVRAGRTRRAGLGSAGVAALSLAVAAVAGIALAAPARAQVDEATLQLAQGGGVIRQVVVEGNQRIEPETVQSYMTVRPGDAFDPAELDRTLKTLFATGLFADVTLRRSGEDLVVAVVENPIINRVAFEGNKRLDNEKLLEEVKLSPRTVLTKAKVQADTQRLVELYRRSGRFAATVEPKLVELPQNRVDLIFEINEGPVTGISRINFIGNEVFSDGKLRGAIRTTESRWWKFLSSDDNFDPDRVSYDKELLRQYYLKRGYADFRVVSAVAELTPDREDFFVTFTVEEGEQYRIADIDVTTEFDALDTEQLKQLVTLQPGEIYDAEQIEKTIDNLTYAAGAAGYAFVDVRPRVRRDREAQTIGITFQVDEGPRVYVERINIVGNMRTLDRVIRREFRIVEGDAFNRVLIDRSRSRIRGLGFFKEVEVTEEPGSAPDRTVLNVEVEEQPTGELSIGAGFSSADAFIADLSITERNLLGRGQFLRFRVSLSDRRETFDISFTEPYFLGRQLAAGVDLFKVRTDYQDESSFDTDSYGGGYRLGFPLTEFSRLSLNYSLRVDDITNVDSGASLAIRDQIGKRTTSLAGFTYRIDMRDDPIEPTRGWDATWSETFAGIGGSVRYIQSELGLGWYRGLWDDVVFSLQSDAGYIVGWGDKDVRLNDRFFKGGSSFRGFATGGVGPHDIVTEDAVGGKAYAIGTAELSFPLGLPEEFGITGSIFTDFGAVGLVDQTNYLLPIDSNNDGMIDGADTPLTSTIADDFSMRVSAGVSIFWESPFGPVRLDFAEAFLKEDYDKTEVFRFSAGTRF